MSSLGRFGLMLEPQEGMSVNEVLQWAEYAEKSGYGYIFRSDHLLPTSGARGIDSPECWVTLGAIAARTKDIRFGPMVSPIGTRNPATLARMACTLHSFSNGRLQFGVGAGWYKDEYDANGYPFPDTKTRKKQLIESLRIMIPLVRGERVDLDGEFFKAHTDCYPKPTGRVNVIIGGKTPSMVRIAATYADEWNIFAPTRERYTELRRVSDSMKQDLTKSMTGPCIVAENQASLDEAVKRWMTRHGASEELGSYLKRLKGQGVIIGKPADFVSELKDRMEWGIERFYFQVDDPTDKRMFALLTETLKRF